MSVCLHPKTQWNHGLPGRSGPSVRSAVVGGSSPAFVSVALHLAMAWVTRAKPATSKCAWVRQELLIYCWLVRVFSVSELHPGVWRCLPLRLFLSALTLCRCGLPPRQAVQGVRARRRLSLQLCSGQRQRGLLLWRLWGGLSLSAGNLSTSWTLPVGVSSPVECLLFPSGFLFLFCWNTNPDITNILSFQPNFSSAHDSWFK